MSDENLLTLFPQKRIRPYDGMSITAEVWEQAHAYHNQVQQAHNRAFHGSGILSGLEVIASDPPDRLIYILPGSAIDAAGRVIVLPEAVAYDIGNDIEGALFLFISHRESLPPLDDTGKDTEPRYIESQFSITARSSQPAQAVVELARFTREGRSSFLKDALNPLRPQANEIDLRYRTHLEPSARELVSIGVVYLGSVAEKIQGGGLSRMAAELGHTHRFNLVVDDDRQLDPGILGYGLVYLAIEGSFKLSPTQVKGLQGYLEHGGSLLLDCLNSDAKKAGQNLATQLGASLAPVGKAHPLMLQPHLFNQSPAGYETEGELLEGGGLLLNTFNYGWAWAGKAKDHPLSRDETRCLVEWTANVLAYVLERQKAAQPS
jgi:hypothetical protein